MLETTVEQTWPRFDPADGELDVICKLSHYYGRDPSIVLAGGGNTSCKIGNRLYVKASGTSLATIAPEGFVEMDRDQLDELVTAELDPDVDIREAQYQEALSAARCEPEKGQRPSVEVLLHHLVPDKYVVHSHATIVNTLTCHTNGRQLAEEIFGDDILWLPFVDPGFILGQELKAALEEHSARTSEAGIKAILMANHGLIVAADDPEQIRACTEEVLGKIEARLGNDWQSGSFGAPRINENAAELVNVIAPALRGLLGSEQGNSLSVVGFDDSDVILSLVGSEAGRTAASSGPLTPDQIVYCNSFPLWFEPQESGSEDELIARLRDAIVRHTEATQFPPKIVLVSGVGMFAVGSDFHQANTAKLLYLDATKVMAGATRLGGISTLGDRDRRFIEDWKVEAYCKQVAASLGRTGGRLQNKVAVVTGAAQGFGLEIARGLAAEGSCVVLTDLNESGAKSAAKELCEKYGAGRSLGLPIDVTSSESIHDCIAQVVRSYGGFDIFISNAGVLKAESVKTQPECDFDLVTDVNYKGYYLCVQQAAPVLATQRKACAAYRSDIIQINSKSGLVGSKKNFAYAGSKFGGIGLTQSFALELVEDGIKVNSICPGNFFDGPLWSDPENGLFVQYLRAGKVPGATTVQDVRRFYEAKVPMGRGCRAEDVVTAILYVVDQIYETGQAIPVTGGQEMLR